jgi:hypothetical protein
MNRIVLFGLFAILVLLIAYYRTPRTPRQKDLQKTNTEIVSLVPVDAQCRTEIQEVYYNFEKEAKLGKVFIDERSRESLGLSEKEPYHSLNKSIEYFALSPDIYTDVTKLDANKTYLVGKLNTSNTTTPAQNGGKTCQEYPQTVYKLYVPPPIDCDIDVDWDNMFCGSNSKGETVVYNYVNVRTQPQNNGRSCVDVLKQKYWYTNPVLLYDTYMYDEDGYVFRDYNDCREYVSYF